MRSLKNLWPKVFGSNFRAASAFKVTERLVVEGIVGFVRFYQALFSADHGMFNLFFGGARCRFYPSCSEYTVKSLRQYGLLVGGVASSKRLIRCNPWSQGGYDPASKPQ